MSTATVTPSPDPLGEKVLTQQAGEPFYTEFTARNRGPVIERADGLATSFLSQAIEVPELRARSAELLDHEGYPQLLLRVGYSRRPARSAPWRPLRDVLSTDAVRITNGPAAASDSRAPQDGVRQ